MSLLINYPQFSLSNIITAYEFGKIFDFVNGIINL